MKLIGLFILLFNHVLGHVLAQPDGDGQQVTLDKETIDAIAAKASPVCRSELEAALEQQAEISMGCKQEIHSILLTLSDKYASSQEGLGNDEVSASAPPANGVGIWIAVFLVVVTIAIGAYVQYVNSALAEAGVIKEKKPLSKKKMEKMRMKGKA